MPTIISSVAECSDQSLEESRLTFAQLDQLAAAGLVVSRPSLVSGAVVFAGTRVPIYNLWDYLSGGDSIGDFLESFPSVSREQVEQVIRLTQGEKKAREHSL